MTFQSKSGLKTVGTVHLKEKLEQGTTTSQDGVDLTWAEAARKDSRNLVQGIGEMPEGTDEEIISELLGEETIKLAGNPDFMNTRNCAKYLKEQIKVFVKRQVYLFSNGLSQFVTIFSLFLKNPNIGNLV